MIDIDDLEKVIKYNWFASENGYITRSESGKPFALHRELMHVPIGFVVDHRNGDKYDNRKSNMRVCTQQQNSSNTKKRDNTSSQFKGVTLRKDGKWQSGIQLNGKRIYIGYYDNEVTAAIAYDAMAKRLFGEFAKPNFV